MNSEMTIDEIMQAREAKVAELVASGRFARFDQFSKKAVDAKIDSRFTTINSGCNCGVNGCGISKKNGGLGHAGY